jgi:pyridoxal phosphate enzyme (YggS family)
MSPTPNELTENLARVRERIERAAKRSGRRPEEITLVAVSKTHSARKIQDLYGAGVRHFGENRVQERESKLAHLAGLEATWHMIGHLQKNKAGRAAALFDSVDSLDDITLADKLNRARETFAAPSAGEASDSPQSISSNPVDPMRVLIEVKLDPGPAKTGLKDQDVPRLVEALLLLPHLALRGLMGVPPYSDNPEDARPHFRRLRETRDALRSRLGRETLSVLSMGMSHDFEIAIEEGATEVRVGTALFGERESA